jgi:hypothetical protein
VEYNSGMQEDTGRGMCKIVGFWRYVLAIENYGDNNVPLYSGKHTLSGTRLIFSSKRSFLFRNRMIDVSVNH